MSLCLPQKTILSYKTLMNAKLVKITQHPAFIISLLSLILALTTVLPRVSLQLSFEQFANNNLSTIINQSLESGFNDTNIFPFLTEQLETKYQRIETESLLPIIKSCSMHILDWKVNQELPISSISAIKVTWKEGSLQHQLLFELDCHYDLLNWFISFILCSTLSLLAFSFWPTPYSHRQQQWQLQTSNTLSRSQQVEFNKFIDSLSAPQYQWLETHITSKQWQISDVLNCIKHKSFRLLDSEQLFWLDIAYSQSANLDDTVAIAKHDANLIFDLTEKVILVHGMKIKLPITPFFYYYWYASKRLHNQHQGWLLNPASTKPDRQLGEELARLMSEYGGSTRAINDLLENGLTPKKLDQNRNRIKEELINLLGETHAETYLFSNKRDLKTSRFSYRLAIDSQKITIT